MPAITTGFGKMGGNDKGDEQMLSEVKICGYIVHNLCPQYASKKEQEQAEQAKIREILMTYHKIAAAAEEEPLNP